LVETSKHRANVTQVGTGVEVRWLVVIRVIRVGVHYLCYLTSLLHSIQVPCLTTYGFQQFGFQCDSRVRNCMEISRVLIVTHGLSIKSCPYLRYLGRQWSRRLGLPVHNLAITDLYYCTRSAQDQYRFVISPPSPMR
jgi:hypothetical protein